MEFTYEQKFNAIYVIQSLGPTDRLKTGKALFCDQLKPLCKKNHVNSFYCELSKKQGFLNVMRRIWKHCETESIYPIIHLEMHGNQDGGGLVISNGDDIRWSEFVPLCKGINRACNNNLFLVMAVCHGYQAIRKTSIKDISPFCTLIGPSSTVTAGEIQRDFPKFYKQLFQTGDIDQAYHHLSNGYGLYKCEQTFIECLVRYLREQCRGKEKKGRTERLLTEALKNRVDGNIPISKIRRKIKKLIQPKDQSLERFRTRFLMLDVPENKNRFSASCEDAINIAFRE